MALFKQKAENPTAATEYEIASLGARRPALERHLVDATAAVDRSVAELRTALLEGEDAAAEAKLGREIMPLRDQDRALRDALAAIEVKCSEAQERLERELEKLTREAEVERCREDADQLQQALDGFGAAAATLVERFVSISQVLRGNITGPALAKVASEFTTAGEIAVREIRAYADRVATGGPILRAPSLFITCAYRDAEASHGSANQSAVGAGSLQTRVAVVDHDPRRETQTGVRTSRLEPASRVFGGAGAHRAHAPLARNCGD
jgi:hypothetical protein